MTKQELKKYLNDKYKITTWMVEDPITKEMEVMRYSDYLVIINDILQTLEG